MLEISHITKDFGSQTVLRDTNLKICEGEFFSLLGPSGCGKTTLLRILAGFEAPTSGDIILDGEKINSLTPQQRPFNMVFQKYALFPHLTVEENVTFGLRMKKIDAGEQRKRTQEMLELIGLKSFAKRYPDTLSGGQSQRVAVARALVNRPKMLLLDEPLSALDLKMREYMQVELKSLQRKLGLTFIFVTHDQEEAFALSDRVAVMNNGQLEQISTPQELYEKPGSKFVAEFIGNMNKIPGAILSRGAAQSIFVRPEKIKFSTGAKGGHCLGGTVVQKTFRGDHDDWLLEVAPDCRIVVSCPVGSQEFEPGQRVEVTLESKDIFEFGSMA